MIPEVVKPYLWSYNLDKIDLQKHKRLIIAQILNYGSKQATDWLFSAYTKYEIKRIAQQIPYGQWNKKSLTLWSLLLDIHPMSRQERIQFSNT